MKNKIIKIDLQEQRAFIDQLFNERRKQLASIKNRVSRKFYFNISEKIDAEYELFLKLADLKKLQDNALAV